MQTVIRTLKELQQQHINRLAIVDQMIALAEGLPRQNAPQKVNGRMMLKESVLEEIKAVSPNGIAVKDIAKSIGVHTSRLGTWFATTGKHLKQIRKISRGIYAWADGETK